MKYSMIFNDHLGLFFLIGLISWALLLIGIAKLDDYHSSDREKKIWKILTVVSAIIGIPISLVWVVSFLCTFGLHGSAKSGSLEEVKTKIETTYLSVEELDYYHRTPLHYAAKSGASEENTLKVIDYLLQKGANINAQDKYGNSPLHYAVMENRETTVQRLLDGGCNPNIGNNKGNTPLHYAVQQTSRKLVEALLQHGADLSIKNNQGLASIDIAKQINDQRVMELTQESIEKIARLQQQEAEKALKEKQLQQQQDEARKEEAKKAEALKEKEDARKKLEQYGESLSLDGFILAAKAGNIEYLELYLKADVVSDLNAKNGNGITALIEAVRSNQKETIQWLLDRGADANVSTNDGMTALMIVIDESKPLEMMQLLFDRGADVNVRTNDGTTALMIAIDKSRPQHVIQLLLDKGANVNDRSQGGITALMIAAKKGMIRAIEVLIQKQANLEMKDHTGNTALMKAVENGQLEAVQILLTNNADHLVPNSDGKTACMLAVEKRHIEIVKYLIDMKKCEIAEHDEVKRLLESISTVSPLPTITSTVVPKDIIIEPTITPIQ